MVFWNTWHWNIYTTLGAFQRRFLTDLEKERCLILNDHMLVKPGHDDEVDEEDDGGDEGEDTERQDGTILHLKWVIMHNLSWE